MAELDVKRMILVICIGLLIISGSVAKEKLDNFTAGVFSDNQQTGVKMWDSDSANTYNQVVLEVARLHELFQELIGMRKLAIETYQDTGSIPKAYNKEIEDMVVASPYDEVQHFVVIINTYKEVLQHYIYYIVEEEVWDISYVEAQQEKMLELIEIYIEEVEKVAAK